MSVSSSSREPLPRLTPSPETNKTSSLWSFRRVAGVSFLNRLLLAGLIAAGIGAIVRLVDWWFREIHVADTTLFILLSLAFWYGIGRILVGWFNVIAVVRPSEKSAPQNLRVAIFTTSSPGEPLSMFEKTLAACRKITYPHTTYLLDDTRDPRFREVAEKHGAVWLGLVGLPGAKAGKINAALKMTKEDYILVLDPDHIPFPIFFDRVLGHFDDPKVGFVQVSQAYYNQERSFVARAAAEQTYSFYGPVMMGLFGHGTNLAIGANCTFRRSALESIGGHGIGLAEDLVTTIRLHATGWKSVYVPEIVSRGLVPEDLGSFAKQQLKWARGVYEILFTELPHLFRTLTWRQRISYSMIGTYYLCGVTTFIYLVIPYVYLWLGIQPASMPFEGFLISIFPVGLLGAVVYLYAQRWLCHPERETGLHWRGLMLKVGLWPIYFLGTVLAILKKDIPYIPTSKEAQTGRFLTFAWPHIVVLAMYVLTVARVLWERLVYTSQVEIALTTEAVWGMVAFATMTVVMMSGALYAAWKSTQSIPGFAWDSIDVEKEFQP